MTNTERTERKVNSIVEEILNEDQDEDLNITRSGFCSEDCNQSNDASNNASNNASKEVRRRCKCSVENSSRFSLRVMEAMRALQRNMDQPATSTAEDIVDHIRANYRNDGDLYSQVRTALRQVCSQGFVVELLNNEYHLIGPVVTLTSRCLPDCTARTTNDTSRRRRSVDDRRNDVCRCGRCPRRNGSVREELPEETFAGDLSEDFATEAILHSTRRSINETNNAASREISRIHETELRDERASTIAGPSGALARQPSLIPMRRETRPEDQKMLVADRDDQEATTEEDSDCVCDTDVIDVTVPSKSQPRSPRRVIRNRGDKRQREEITEEEDEDTEDSMYRELRRHTPRRRSKTRDRELKKWIRRCRRECERRAQRRERRAQRRER